MSTAEVNAPVQGVLTPLDIEILLHYHVSPEPFPRTSDHIERRTAYFIEHGILRRDAETGQVCSNDPCMRLYIERLRSVPLPKLRWSVE